MAFNSFAFLFFFALVTLVYYAAPHRWRWPLLLLASVYFYSALDPAYVLLLAYAAIAAYGFGLAAAGKRGTRSGRAWLGAGIVAELAVLVAFKYVDFIAGALEPALRGLGAGSQLTLPRLGLILPAGLSFYTFSCIAYLVDAYRGTIPPERHIGRLALYVAFFPKLLAGPIERAGPFLDQLNRPARLDYERIAAGLWLILWGLFKKVVIADRLAEFADGGFKNVSAQSPVTLALSAYFYAFQIYCDFSGYSDIAIGAALVLGIQLMENFRRPYFAKSIAEFWSQRWHLSLSLWFRDYLYIPLGGRRVSVPRWYLNQLVVFLVSGLWHGANWTFVLWGGINGVLQIGHFAFAGARRRVREVLRVPSWLANAFAVLVTFHLIGITWIFFRAATVNDAFTVMTKIGGALPQFATLLANYNWSDEILGSIGLIVLLMALEALEEVRPIWNRLALAPAALRWGACYALMAALVIIGRWGSAQFVYMQF